MGEILSIVNQKGGVGKTTTAVNLCCALHQAGVRVLLCDFDPQANATSGFGVQKPEDRPSIYDVVIDGTPVREAIVHTPYGDLLPASSALSGAGIELVGLPDRELRLRKALAAIRDDYAIILVDCPPSLELLTLNGLVAADGLLIPVQCEYYALEGLRDLMHTLRAVKKAMNPQLSIFGVVLTMFDGRTNLSMQVAEQVRRYFPGNVFATTIPRNVRLSEAPSHGEPIQVYDRLSRGAEAYNRLAAEMMKRRGAP